MQDAILPVVEPIANTIVERREEKEALGSCLSVLKPIAKCLGAPALITGNQGALSVVIQALNEVELSKEAMALVCSLASESQTTSAISQNPEALNPAPNANPDPNPDSNLNTSFEALRVLVEKSKKECQESAPQLLALPCLARVVTAETSVCSSLVQDGILPALSALLSGRKAAVKANPPPPPPPPAPTPNEDDDTEAEAEAEADAEPEADAAPTAAPPPPAYMKPPPTQAPAAPIAPSSLFDVPGVEHALLIVAEVRVRDRIRVGVKGDAPFYISSQ